MSDVDADLKLLDSTGIKKDDLNLPQIIKAFAGKYDKFLETHTALNGEKKIKDHLTALKASLDEYVAADEKLNLATKKTKEAKKKIQISGDRNAYNNAEKEDLAALSARNGVLDKIFSDLDVCKKDFEFLKLTKDSDALKPEDKDGLNKKLEALQFSNSAEAILKGKDSYELGTLKVLVQNIRNIGNLKDSAIFPSAAKLVPDGSFALYTSMEKFVNAHGLKEAIRQVREMRDEGIEDGRIFNAIEKATKQENQGKTLLDIHQANYPI